MATDGEEGGEATMRRRVDESQSKRELAEAGERAPRARDGSRGG